MPQTRVCGLHCHSVTQTQQSNGLPLTEPSACLKDHMQHVTPKTGIVYSIPPCFKKTYVGETSRHIGDCLQEHASAVKAERLKKMCISLNLSNIPSVAMVVHQPS